MTVLARRNKTRWIKLMKKRGLVYKAGKLWKVFKWQLVIENVFAPDCDRDLYLAAISRPVQWSLK